MFSERVCCWLSDEEMGGQETDRTSATQEDDDKVVAVVVVKNPDGTPKTDPSGQVAHWGLVSLSMFSWLFILAVLK